MSSVISRRAGPDRDTRPTPDPSAVEAPDPSAVEAVAPAAAEPAAHPVPSATPPARLAADPASRAAPAATLRRGLLVHELPWLDPAEAFAAWAGTDGLAFLDSGGPIDERSRYSILCVEPFRTLTCGSAGPPGPARPAPAGTPLAPGPETSPEAAEPRAVADPDAPGVHTAPGAPGVQTAPGAHGVQTAPDARTAPGVHIAPDAPGVQTTPDFQGVRIDGVPVPGDPFTVLADQLSRYALEPGAGPVPFAGGAVGLLGYGLGRWLERLPCRHPDDLAIPDLCIGLYDLVIGFDRADRRAWVIASGFPETDPPARAQRAATRAAAALRRLAEAAPPASASTDTASRPPHDTSANAAAVFANPVPVPADATSPSADEASSPTGPASTPRDTRDPAQPRDTAQAPDPATPQPPGPALPPLHWRPELDRAGYAGRVRRAQELIRAGDIFEVNVTMRHVAARPPGLADEAAHLALRAASANPFGAFLRCGPRLALASASPERFLRLDADGWVETRPIKGTTPRGATQAEDEARRRELAASEKDRAENLMIVDLMRNDLGRVCRIGSVSVPALFGVETFASVHHLVSVVRGRLREGLGPVDLLRATFPGGSVTGAPKIRALEVIDELESSRRGPYCGAVVAIGFDGAMDSSIVIRTLVLTPEHVVAQAGGAVVSDSDPDAEYDEMLTKVSPLLRILGPTPPE